MKMLIVNSPIEDVQKFIDQVNNKNKSVLIVMPIASMVERAACMILIPNQNDAIFTYVWTKGMESGIYFVSGYQLPSGNPIVQAISNALLTATQQLASDRLRDEMPYDEG